MNLLTFFTLTVVAEWLCLSDLLVIIFTDQEDEGQGYAST